MDIGYNSDNELPLYKSPVDKSPVDKLLIDNIKKQILGLVIEIDILYRLYPMDPPLRIKGGMSYHDYFNNSKNIWSEMIKPTCKEYIALNKDINDPTIQLEIAKNVLQIYLKNIYMFEINSILKKNGYETTSENINKYIDSIDKSRQYINTSFEDMFLMTELQKNQIVRSIVQDLEKAGGKKTRKFKNFRKYRKTRKSNKSKKYKRSRKSRKLKKF